MAQWHVNDARRAVECGAATSASAARCRRAANRLDEAVRTRRLKHTGQGRRGREQCAGDLRGIGPLHGRGGEVVAHDAVVRIVGRPMVGTVVVVVVRVRVDSVSVPMRVIVAAVPVRVRSSVIVRARDGMTTMTMGDAGCVLHGVHAAVPQNGHRAVEGEQ